MKVSFDYRIMQVSNGSVLEEKCNNSCVITCGLLPKDESSTLNRLLIKEINELVRYQCFENDLPDPCTGWTQ